MITLDREIELFWKRKISGATVLFMTNKYIYLLELLASLFAHNTTFVDRDNASIIRARHLWREFSSF